MLKNILLIEREREREREREKKWDREWEVERVRVKVRESEGIRLSPYLLPMFRVLRQQAQDMCRHPVCFNIVRSTSSRFGTSSFRCTSAGFDFDAFLPAGVHLSKPLFCNSIDTDCLVCTVPLYSLPMGGSLCIWALPITNTHFNIRRMLLLNRFYIHILCLLVFIGG